MTKDFSAVDEDLGSLQPCLVLGFGTFSFLSEHEESIVSFNGIYMCKSPRGRCKKKISQDVGITLAIAGAEPRQKERFFFFFW